MNAILENLNLVSLAAVLMAVSWYLLRRFVFKISPDIVEPEAINPELIKQNQIKDFMYKLYTSATPEPRADKTLLTYQLTNGDIATVASKLEWTDYGYEDELLELSLFVRFTLVSGEKLEYHLNYSATADLDMLYRQASRRANAAYQREFIRNEERLLAAIKS